MADETKDSKSQFFYPIGRYRGVFSPEYLAFNANLQEFAQRVSVVCSLETSGKITAEEAYQEVKQLWNLLKESKQNLLDAQKPEPPDLPDSE